MSYSVAKVENSTCRNASEEGQNGEGKGIKRATCQLIVHKFISIDNL